MRICTAVWSLSYLAFCTTPLTSNFYTTQNHGVFVGLGGIQLTIFSGARAVVISLLFSFCWKKLSWRAKRGGGRPPPPLSSRMYWRCFSTAQTPSPNQNTHNPTVWTKCLYKIKSKYLFNLFISLKQQISVCFSIWTDISCEQKKQCYF